MDKNEAFTLLREMLEKFGQTAEHAWPLVIRSFYAECLATVIFLSVVIILLTIASIIAGIMVYRVKVERDAKLVGGAVLMMFCVMILAGCIGSVRKSLPGVIEPEGTFIRTLIGK